MADSTQSPSTTEIVPATDPTEPTETRHETRHDGWTRERMAGFLETLVETASVSLAAKSVGMSRQSAYGLRARLNGQPFDLAWEAALEFGLQQLHHAALDRAMNGVPIPIFYAGEQVGERRHYNEALTRFLLDNPNARPKARRDAHIRAAALKDWNVTVKRVGAGPVVWTPTEVKKALALARIVTADMEADAEKAAQKRRQRHDQSALAARTEQAYEVLSKRFGWDP